MLTRAPTDSDDESAYEARSGREADSSVDLLGGEMRKRGEKQPSKVDHKDAAVASAKAYGKVSPYVLHPNTQFRGVWDAVQIAILCYVALAVPYRMGFGADAYGGWYVFEFFVDVYFWIDLGFGFVTAYWEHITETDDVVYVVDLQKIRTHYLLTWFAVDVLAALPIDYVARGARGTIGCSWDITKTSPCAGQETALNAASSGVLNFFALLRLLKLLRIIRAARIFERYDTVFLTYHAQVSMTKLLVVLCLLSHWMACLYGSVYDFTREDYAGTTNRAWELYVGSLFWAVQTLTTVGYGNVVPQTVSERLLACGVMLMGGFVFSLIIGKVSSLLDNGSAENVEVERSLSLKRFLDNRNVPPALAMRINAHRAHLVANAKPGDREVIAELPKHIRVDVNFFVYGTVVVKSLSGDVLPNEAIIERVCIDMRPTVFTRDLSLAMAGEHTDCVAILTEGVCVVGANERGLFKDDGTKETRRYHREVSKQAKPGEARLCGPGFLINPGLIFGCTRATLCVVPYSKTVEACVWDPETFSLMLKEAHPLLRRNVLDTFLKQLRNSNRGMQKLAVAQIGRVDLWDDARNRLSSGWHAQLRAERVKEDKQRLINSGGFHDEETQKMRAAKLEEATQTEKIEAVQRQVQKMHHDLAEVGNKIGELDKRQKSVGATSGAELRKFQDKVIQVMDAHSEKVDGLETAVHGLFRMLQAVLDDKGKDRKPERGEEKKTVGGFEIERARERGRSSGGEDMERGRSSERRDSRDDEIVRLPRMSSPSRSKSRDRSLNSSRM